MSSSLIPSAVFGLACRRPLAMPPPAALTRMEIAERALHVLRRPAPALVADVGDHHAGTRAVPLDVRVRRGKVRKLVVLRRRAFVLIVHGHIRAELGEPRGDRVPKASAGPRHQRNLTFE